MTTPANPNPSGAALPQLLRDLIDSYVGDCPAVSFQTYKGQDAVVLDYYRVIVIVVVHQSTEVAVLRSHQPRKKLIEVDAPSIVAGLRLVGEIEGLRQEAEYSGDDRPPFVRIATKSKPGRGVVKNRAFRATQAQAQPAATAAISPPAC